MYKGQKFVKHLVDFQDFPHGFPGSVCTLVAAAVVNIIMYCVELMFRLCEDISLFFDNIELHKQACVIPARF